MLETMAIADLRRPWYVVGVASGVVVSVLCLGVSMFVNYQTNNFNPPRLDWFVILQGAMSGTLLFAILAGIMAGIGEAFGRQGLSACCTMSAICLALFVVCYFGFAYLVAMP
ncbi:MAG: hypothetical protein AAGA29_06035 [Planctomycetota bacterium]